MKVKVKVKLNMTWHHNGGSAGITGMLDEIGLFNTVLDDAVIKSYS